jgi:predicted dienelactone hydrolase
MMESTVPLQPRSTASSPKRSRIRSLSRFTPIRTPFLIAAVIFLAASCIAATKEKREKKDAPILHPVGFSFRQFPTPEDYNWRGSDFHNLDGIIWYPSENGADEKDQFIGPPDAPLFYAGRAAKDAVLAPAFNKFPLIALSHGTGGSAMQMAWLGTYLASRGYIVVAVNHPGNNAVTGYTTEGFVEGWERAKDITTAIDGLLQDQRFGSKIDPDCIGAAGFSYGGYAMMELAGAKTDWSRLLAWCNNQKSACNPPEMPDLMERFAALKNKPDVQHAIQHAGDSYRDPRIRAVFAIAPAVAQAFTAEALHEIAIPVEIVVGAADPLAPPADNAQFFATNIRGAKLTILPGGVGHYTFLDVGTDAGKKQFPQLLMDNPGVDREAVHKQVSQMAADLFDKELAPTRKKR